MEVEATNIRKPSVISYATLPKNIAYTEGMLFYSSRFNFAAVALIRDVRH